MGGLLLPLHSPLLRDGDQLPRGMAGGSGLRGHGAAAGKLRYGRTQRVGTGSPGGPCSQGAPRACCLRPHLQPLQGSPPGLCAGFALRTLRSGRAPSLSPNFAVASWSWSSSSSAPGVGFALTMLCLLVGCFRVAHKPLRRVPRELPVFQTIWEQSQPVVPFFVPTAFGTVPPAQQMFRKC